MSNRSLVRSFGSIAFACIGLLATQAGAQAPMMPSHTERFEIDSGLVANNALAGGAVSVFSTVVSVTPGSSWVRLSFEDVVLAGDWAEGTGSYLRVTGVQDDVYQDLNADALEKWTGTSAYFNGDTVLLELFAYPGTGPSRVVVKDVTVGELEGLAESVCGPDDRVISMDPRQGRLAPALCTAWLFDKGNTANRFLTAGHCIEGSGFGYVVNFNVPLSTSSGSYRFPGPENQYPIDGSSVQTSGSGGTGNDYCTFQTTPNTSTGLHAREVQVGAYKLIDTVPSSAPLLHLYGYGDTAPGAQDPLPLTWRYVQTHGMGQMIQRNTYSIRYGIDVEGGNSGSAISGIFNGVEQAIAICTHSSGCFGTTPNNYGTRIDHPLLQGFINNPVGWVAPYTPLPLLETTLSSSGTGPNGGIVYFNITTGNKKVRIPKFELGLAAASVATSFTMNVYTTLGGYEGKTSSASYWTLAGVGSSSTAETGDLTIVPMSQPLTLEANTTYGIAIDLGSSAAHRYSVGSNIYSDDAITIETGAAQAGLGSGGLVTPVTLSGRIGYKTIAEENCLTTIEQPTTGLSGNGCSVFLDVTPIDRNARVLRISSGTFAPFPVNCDVYTYNGSYVGVSENSSAWTLHGSFAGEGDGQDFTMDISNNPIELSANQPTGICIVYRTSSGGLRFQANAQTTYSNGEVTIFSDLAKAAPAFTGTSFTPRTFSGTICYEADDVIVTCEADCDNSEELDLFDILCFLNTFNAGDPEADCDEDENLSLFDILCFLNVFNAGC